MLGLLVGLAVAGVGVSAAGRIVQGRETKKQLALQKQQAAEEARLAQYQAALYEQEAASLVGGEYTTVHEEEIPLSEYPSGGFAAGVGGIARKVGRTKIVTEKKKYTGLTALEQAKKETAAQVAALGEQAQATAGTLTAATAAGGFEAGASFEATQKYYSGKFQEAIGLAQGRGELSAQQIVQQAARLQLGAETARSTGKLATAQMGYLSWQQSMVPLTTGLGITGDILEAGTTIATGALELKMLGML